MLKNKKSDDYKLILLGTGTSQGVPVIGCKCEVCSSPNPKDKRLRTSAIFQSSDISICIDAGPDFRQQMLREGIQKIDAVLLTHEHNDHIIGLDDVRPFNFSSGSNMPVFGMKRVIENVKNRFEYIFAENPYPGAPRIELNNINDSSSFFISTQKVIPIEVMHGTMPILGFRFGEITYLTDVKTMSTTEIDKIRHCKYLVVNALHHSKHHSHLNLEEALDLIKEIRPGKAYLTHISHKMGLHKEINAALPQNVELAYDGLCINNED